MRNGGRIAIVSSHVLLRQAIAEVLRGRGAQVAEALAPADLRGKAPDVVILDLDHAAADCLALLRQLVAQVPDTYVIALGAPATLRAARDGTAHAELDSGTADVTTLLHAVARRPAPPVPEAARLSRVWADVTPRQRDVLRLLAAGMDNATIASRLRIGPRAVKAHVSALLELFRLDSRTQLALMADRAGLRPPGKA